MIRNLTIMRAVASQDGGPVCIQLPAMLDGLEASRFSPCAPTQQMSVGWVSPRSEGGPLAELIGDFLVLRLRIETKPVPASAIRRKVEELAEQIERDTGRKPGRKQRKQLAEEALHGLLPSAFERTADTVVLIDMPRRLVCIGSASTKVTDEVATFLVRAVDGLGLKILEPATKPAAAMAVWLLDGDIGHTLQLGTDCELKSLDGPRAVVRYGRHSLDTAEVRNHLRAGKTPTRLALEWQGRASFILTDKLTLKRIDFDDIEVGGKRRGESFDGDVAIVGGELRSLLADLMAAMGGEAEAP